MNLLGQQKSNHLFAFYFLKVIQFKEFIDKADRFLDRVLGYSTIWGQREGRRGLKIRNFGVVRPQLTLGICGVILQNANLDIGVC